MYAKKKKRNIIACFGHVIEQLEVQHFYAPMACEVVVGGGQKRVVVGVNVMSKTIFEKKKNKTKLFQLMGNVLLFFCTFLS